MFFSFVTIKLSLEVGDIMATGAMVVTGTMVTDVSGVERGALVVAADTGVEAAAAEDTPQAATETIGKKLNELHIWLHRLFLKCNVLTNVCLSSRGQGGYSDRSGTYRDGYDGYGKHE